MKERIGWRFGRIVGFEGGCSGMGESENLGDVDMDGTVGPVVVRCCVMRGEVLLERDEVDEEDRPGAVVSALDQS